MKVLVLGNSHAAAMKSAVDAAAFEVTFAGGSGEVLRDVAFRKDAVALGGKSARLDYQRAFWRATTGGEGPVPLAGFDVVLVVGQVLPPNPWAMTNLEMPGHSVRPWCDDRMPVSWALFRSSCGYRVRIAGAVRLDRGIKAGDPGRRVIFVPRPMIREDAHVFDPDQAAPDAWARLSLEAKAAVAANERALHRRYHEDHGIEVLDLPDELVVDGFRCPAAYSVGALGSENFEAGRRPQWGDAPDAGRMNFTHKNAAYGAAVWRHLNRLLGAGETAAGSAVGCEDAVEGPREDRAAGQTVHPVLDQLEGHGLPAA